MFNESTDDGGDAEIGDISVAADLLRRMLLELQDLEVDNARLHFAMSNTRHGIRRRLDMLSGIAELLKESHAPLHERELCRRAKKIITQLTGDLEELALEAEHEFEWIAWGHCRPRAAMRFQSNLLCLGRFLDECRDLFGVQKKYHMASR